MSSERLLRVRVLALLAAAFSIVGLVSGAGIAHAAENLVTAITQPPDVLAPTQAFTSSITVTNTGDTDAAPFTFTISLPKFTSTTPHPTRTLSLKNGVTCTTYSPRYGNIRKTCTVAALTAGTTLQTATVKFVPPKLAVFPASGVTTTVSVAGPTNSASATYRWREAGLPNLVASAYGTSPATALAGTGPVTFSGVVSNPAYGAAGAFAWRVELPVGATNLAQGAAIASTTCAVAGGGFDCATTGLANGMSLTFSFVFTAPTAPGTYAPAVTVDTGNAIVETNETDNTATGALNVPGSAANLAIAASNPPSAGQYSVFTRTVTVSNVGGSDAANVSFNDYATVAPFEVFSFTAVPAGVSCSRYVTYSGRPVKAHYHGVRCNIGTVPAGTTVAVPYDLVVKNTAPGTYTSTLAASTTSYTDPASTPTGATSISVFVPSPPNPPLNTAVPTLTGNANTGSALTTTTGTWFGAGTLTYAYQWQRCDGSGGNCGDIAGQTASTYTVVPEDVGSTLRAIVTATNAGGSTTVAGAPSDVAVGASAPVSTIAPALIPGLEKQPTFLWSVTPGEWDGTPTITFAYQWMRCVIGGGDCVDIGGATSASYVLQEADVFHSVQVRVTASNTAGSAVAYSSVSGEIDPLG